MSTMFGSYKIVSELGRGAFGVVNKALTKDNKFVALKIVHFKNLTPDTYKKMQARFIREARAGCQISHLNVVRSFQYGEWEKKFFLVSEFVDGASLKQMLKEKGFFTEKQALGVFIKILYGLDAIYRSQMIHRDIKPANILISKDGIVKIADLGLVRSNAFQDFQTATGTILGTPSYMSPEQINADKKIDIRTDLYSLGITLFELLSGAVIYTGTQAEVIYKHCAGSIPDIRDYKPETSKNIALLIKQMMAKNPEERPNNPQHVLEMLRKVNMLENFDIPVVNNQTFSCVENFDDDSIENYKDTIDQQVTIDLKQQISLHIVSPLNDSKLNKKRLSRAKIIIRTKKSTKILFVYTNPHVFLGRNSLDIEGQTICLRFLEKGNQEKTMGISGRHFNLIINKNEVSIMDLQSKGTYVDQNILRPFIPYSLTQEHYVDANSLKLKMQIYPSDNVLRKIIFRKENNQDVAIGEIKNDQNSVLIQRLNDQNNHYYLIAPSSVRVKITEQEILLDKQGELELMSWAGYLWLCGYRNDRHICKPIVEDESFNISDYQINIEKIKGEDQKG